MTNQTPESVIAEVLDEERYYDRSQISNDSRATEIVEALRAANMLREPGKPDAATAAIARVRAVLSAWEMVQARNRECLESGNPGMIVPIDCTGGLRAALDGAPEPGLSESERLEIDGTPYVFSPDSLSYQIAGWVHDLGLPGDSMLREFGVQDGSYFEDPTVLSEKLQEVTIAWLEEHGYRRDVAPEPEEKP